MLFRSVVRRYWHFVAVVAAVEGYACTPLIVAASSPVPRLLPAASMGAPPKLLNARLAVQFPGPSLDETSVWPSAASRILVSSGPQLLHGIIASASQTVGARAADLSGRDGVACVFVGSYGEGQVVVLMRLDKRARTRTGAGACQRGAIFLLWVVGG